MNQTSGNNAGALMRRNSDWSCLVQVRPRQRVIHVPKCAAPPADSTRMDLRSRSGRLPWICPLCLFPGQTNRLPDFPAGVQGRPRPKWVWCLMAGIYPVAEQWASLTPRHAGSSAAPARGCPLPGDRRRQNRSLTAQPRSTSWPCSTNVFL
jgi:hypothetical protein